MDDLRLIGPFHNTSGYSKLTRAVLRTALLAEYRVQAIESDYRVVSTYYAHGEIKERRRYEKFSKKFPVPDIQRTEVEQALRTKVAPDAPTLLIQFPRQVGGWHEYSRGPRIAWTMVESDRITHPDWLKGLYGCDLLIAPSKYVFDTFRRCVPEMPLELLPLPVDDRIFNTEPGDVEIRSRFPDYLFLSIFNNRERKQWRMMMQAFAEEFGEDESVGLIVRANRSGEVQELADWLRPEKRGAARQIFVLNEWVSEEALAAWYRRCDCYVLPSCEGFGLPFVEAALCGKPSIALDGGGAADIVDESTGWLVKSKPGIVYGNLPHVYDSKHRFAVPDSFEAVRAAFRRAFESKEAKGAAAQAKAESAFVPSVLAPRLRECIEKAEKPFRKRTEMWGTKVYAPQWGLLVGDGYGDALGVLGNAQHVLTESLGSKLNILHYGFNKGLKPFLELQDCIGEVRRIEPPDKETAKEVGNEVGAYYAYPKEKWLPKLLVGTGIDPDTVALTQIRWPWGTWPVHRPQDVRLSEDAEKWAEQKRAELGEFVLVQPFSTSSVGMQEHWPFWNRFLNWLLRATESSHLLVFCGLNPIPGLKGPNVVDLIGQTPTMMHLFALSDHAKGCITTCNALANWTACRGTKSLIAGNHAIPRPDMFWPRFMSTPNNRLLMVNTSLPAFIKEAQKWLREVSK